MLSLKGCNSRTQLVVSIQGADHARLFSALPKLSLKLKQHTTHMVFSLRGPDHSTHFSLLSQGLISKIMT